MLPMAHEAADAAAHNSCACQPARAGNPRALAAAAWLSSAVVLALGYGREIAAAAAGVESRSFGLADLRLDAESSLPSWYSATLMLVSALLMLLVARHDGSPEGRKTRRHWGVLGIIFVLLSADETISLHEQLMPVMHRFLDVSGPFYFGWVVAGLAAVVVLGLAYLPFLLRVGRRTAMGLVLAGTVYVGGALGLEMLGGFVYERFGATRYYVFVTSIEETLEIVGLTVLFGVLARHAGRVLPPLRLADELAGSADPASVRRHLPRRPAAA